MAGTEKPLLAEMKENAYLVLAFLGVMWLVLLLGFVIPGGARSWGIEPRTILGLRGIVFAPFVHANVFHLIANTVPFAVLGYLVTMHGQGTFLRVTAFVVVVGGLLTWLLARTAMHVGASGLIMGYLGYLLARGWSERSLGSLVIAVIAFLFYGGALWGITPLVPPFVSWEMHLFGFVAGILAARTPAIGGAVAGR